MQRSRLSRIVVRRPGAPAASATRVCAAAEPSGSPAGRRTADVVWRVSADAPQDRPPRAALPA